MNPGTRRIVVYGDFNCPFSALASARLAVLEQETPDRIEWRAVQHSPALPPDGQPLPAATNAGELAEVRRWMTVGDGCDLPSPVRRFNAALACRAYAGTDPVRRPNLRWELFTATWERGLDLGDAAIIQRLAGEACAPGVAAQWQQAWEIQDRPVVPLMVLGDGVVSRGLSALVRLGRMIDDGGRDQRDAELGGEAPCLAHLVADATLAEPSEWRLS